MPSVENQIVLGYAEVKGTMEYLWKTASKSAVRRGLYAGAVLLRDEARRRVPIRTGALRRSIEAVTTNEFGPDGKRDQPVGRVRISKKIFAIVSGKNGQTKARLLKGAKNIKGRAYPRNYAHLVEYGTRAHFLGSSSSTGHKMHPGARPKPFLRPAWDAKREAAVNRAAEVTKAIMEKAVSSRKKK